MPTGALPGDSLTAGPRDRFGGQEFRNALVGQVFNLITPTALGADAYRVVMAGSRDGGRTRALAMLVLERFGSAYALAFLLAFAVGTDGSANEIMSGAALFFAGVLACSGGSHHRGALSCVARHALPDFFGLARVREAIGQVATLAPWRLLCAVALTFAGLGAWLLCLGVIVRASGVPLPAHVILEIAVVTEMRATPAHLDPGHRRARGDVCRAGGSGRRGGDTGIRRVRNRLRTALSTERGRRDCRAHVLRLQAPAPPGVMRLAEP